MSKTNVTVQELTTAASALSELNASFRSKVTELGNAESELGGMWQGEANNAFRTAFSGDRDQWNTFATIVDQYIEALNVIAQGYSTAEQANTQEAKNRTY